jgi:hypothetical protein
VRHLLLRLSEQLAGADGVLERVAPCGLARLVLAADRSDEIGQGPRRLDDLAQRPSR